MLTKDINDVPTRHRDGLTSYILLQQGDTQSDRLAITWVEVAPGKKQKPHFHAPEQAYVIIQGEGLMKIDNETQKITEGMMAYIPSNATHAIENTGSDALVYLSASTPAFALSELYDSGQLKSEE